MVYQCKIEVWVHSKSGSYSFKSLSETTKTVIRRSVSSPPLVFRSNNSGTLLKNT